MMLRNAEKLAFTDATAVEVCEKVMSVSDGKQKEPYIYGILRNTGHGMDYS